MLPDFCDNRMLIVVRPMVVSGDLIFATSALQAVHWRPSCYVGVGENEVLHFLVFLYAIEVVGFPMGEQGRESRLTVFYSVSLFLSPINPFE